MVDVAMSAGWTIDYTLDTLTMTWLKALRKHWRLYPPMHKVLAAFAGYEAPPSLEEAASQTHPGGVLTLMFPNGQINVRPNAAA